MEPVVFPAGMTLYEALRLLGADHRVTYEILPPVQKPTPPPCLHRFYMAYDDGDGRWDLHCLECDDWPERDELHPCAVSCYEIDDEARAEFAENLTDTECLGQR